MTVQTYIQLLLIGVPLALLAAHWREAWAVLDRWFGDFNFGPRRAGDPD